jgi:hypothetical protein
MRLFALEKETGVLGAQADKPAQNKKFLAPSVASTEEKPLPKGAWGESKSVPTPVNVTGEEKWILSISPILI